MNAREKGFSLLEMLIASVIFAIISGAVVAVLNQSQRAFQTQNVFNEAGVEARMALHHVMRTLRQAGNDPLDALAGAGVDAIEILGQNHFRINSDITGTVAAASTSGHPKEKAGQPDGSLDAINEQVEYRFDPDTKQLFVNVGYGETLLASDIEAFLVRFFDDFGVETSVQAEISRVQVTLVASSDTASRQTSQKNLVTLRSEMTIRSKNFDLYSLF